MDMAAKKSYFQSLTSLRGIFILMIVIFHVNHTFQNCFPNVLGFIYKYGGYLGNYYFFMMSGFVLNHSYKDKISANQLNMIPFISKRIIKIYPLYFLSNLFMLLYYIGRDGFSSAFDIKDMLEILLLVCYGWVKNVTPYNLPCWFVSTLMLCYIVYYLIVKIFGRHRSIYYLAIAAMILWGSVLIQKDWQFPFSFVQNGEGFLNFFIGAGLNEFMKRKNFGKLEWIKIGCFIFILSVLGIINRKEFVLLISDKRMIIAVLVCPLIIISAIHFKALSDILSAAPLYFLGKISMSIFYWHVPLANMFVVMRGCKFLGGGVGANENTVYYLFDTIGIYV